MKKTKKISRQILPLAPDNVVQMVWGGSWISKIKNLDFGNVPIGESWELSAHELHPNHLTGPAGERTDLRAVIASDPEGILGKAVVKKYGKTLPILAKFIDAAEQLSVQVHPPEAYARRHEKSSGKSESWMILDAASGPRAGFIYLGFNPATRAKYASAAAFEKAFRRAVDASLEKKILPFLNKIKVKAGDIFALPPGTIHAIGGGVRLFELQQSSGITYRVWDWGRPRELHLKQAFDVLDFTAAIPEPLPKLRDPLGNYGADHYDFKKRGDWVERSSKGCCVAVTVVDGEVEVGSEESKVRLKAGRTCLVPAAIERYRISIVSNGAEIILSRPLTD